MDTIEITIKVDTNDADYMTETNTISKENLDKIRPLIEAIKNFKPYKGKDYKSSASRTGEIMEGHIYNHNYPHGEYSPRIDMGEFTPQEIYSHIDEEVFEIFEELCPYGEYGFHTVEAVSIQINPQKEVLL